ncbi:MAG: hypothetical protein E7Z83_03500 [Methanobrevibacter sp.]|nr:hypothetical protein [Methanobrevibacter sp.]MBE6489907.1 hypothetical protein [Methanobrevibacter sp.]
MSIKNILLISIICLVLSVGAISAVTIEGDSFISMNCMKYDYMPEGDAVEVSSDTIGEKYVNMKNNDEIQVLYTEGHTTNKYEELGYVHKTINETNGYYLENGTETNFIFDYGDNTIIMISASDASIIEKIVIGNDVDTTMKKQGIDI